MKREPLRIVPLGDRAFLVYLPDEAAAFRFAQSVRNASPPWLEDVVPAYASVGVFFNVDQTSAAAVATILRGLPTGKLDQHASKLHVIPCCYELQLDLDRVAEHCRMYREEVIRLHTANAFAVYAIGFCPGFPYLGYLPPELSGVPRLPTPRIRVEPGSVGLTARQTGLYPLARPGGWNLIGRTPLVVADVEAGFFPIRVGDRVRFERIGVAEYHHLEGKRL